MRKQFISKLAIDPYPGTLNLEIVDPKDAQNLRLLKATQGVEIIPEDPSFCSAKCFPVLIQGKLQGGIVLPIVEGYPENKVELIASQNVKETFSLKEGDMLEMETVGR